MYSSSLRNHPLIQIGNKHLFHQNQGTLNRIWNYVWWNMTAMIHSQLQNECHQFQLFDNRLSQFGKAELLGCLFTNSILKETCGRSKGLTICEVNWETAVSCFGHCADEIVDELQRNWLLLFCKVYLALWLSTSVWLVPLPIVPLIFSSDSVSVKLVLLVVKLGQRKKLCQFRNFLSMIFKNPVSSFFPFLTFAFSRHSDEEWVR